MRRLALALAVLVLGTAAFAAADALRTLVTNTNGAIHKAIMNRDMDAYKTAMKAGAAKDLKCYFKSKSVTLDQMAADLKGALGQMDTIKSEEAILLSLVKRGDTATGTTEHKIKGATAEADGVVRKIAFYGTSVETYRKVKGKWLLAKQVWRTRQVVSSGGGAK